MVSWCGKPQLQDIQPPNLFRVAFRNGPVAVCFDPRRTAVPSRRGSERSGAEGSRADEKTQEGSRRRKAKSFLGLHLVFLPYIRPPPDSETMPTFPHFWVTRDAQRLANQANGALDIASPHPAAPRWTHRTEPPSGRPSRCPLCARSSLSRASGDPFGWKPRGVPCRDNGSGGCGSLWVVLG